MLHEAITGSYADYDYYINEYGSRKIPEEMFGFYAKKAEAFLNMITFDRIKRLEEVPELVKDAVCEMADIAYQYSKKPCGVRSEDIDGYKVAYNDSGSKQMNVEMTRAARLYLENTGLLYKGRSRCYDREC